MSSSERYPDHCYSCERPCKYAGPDPSNGAMRCQQCLDLAAARARVVAALEGRVRELEGRMMRICKAYDANHKVAAQDQATCDHDFFFVSERQPDGTFARVNMCVRCAALAPRAGEE